MAFVDSWRMHLPSLFSACQLPHGWDILLLYLGSCSEVTSSTLQCPIFSWSHLLQVPGDAALGRVASVCSDTLIQAASRPPTLVPPQCP